jgi:hypothetical protein
MQQVPRAPQRRHADPHRHGRLARHQRPVARVCARPDPGHQLYPIVARAARGMQWALPLLWVFAASAMLAYLVNGTMTSPLPNSAGQRANAAPTKVIADVGSSCTWIGPYCAFRDR